MRSKPRKRTSVALRRRRCQLLRQIPPLDRLLRGSLIERYKPCGKPGCKCARGPGHGPKYYLSVSRYGQRPQMDYIPQDRSEERRVGKECRSRRGAAHQKKKVKNKGERMVMKI